jgi:hypothetical protein
MGVVKRRELMCYGHQHGYWLCPNIRVTRGCNVVGFCGPEIVFGRSVDARDEPMMSGVGAPTMSLSSESDDDMACELMQVKSIIKGNGLCGNQYLIKHTSLCKVQTEAELSLDIPMYTLITGMCTSVYTVDKSVYMQKTGEL